MTEESFLETVMCLYGKLFETKEEMFLAGYLMAFGGERHLLRLFEEDLKLLDRDARFFLPIVMGEMRIWRKVHEDSVEHAKKLLVKLLKQRNVSIPEWLQEKR